MGTVFFIYFLLLSLLTVTVFSILIIQPSSRDPGVTITPSRDPGVTITPSRSRSRRRNECLPASVATDMAPS